MKRTLVLFSIAGAFAGCGFLGPQEQVRQEPGRTTYRVPETIRWSVLTSHPFEKKFRVNPVKSEPDWQRSKIGDRKSAITTQALVTVVEPSQLLIFSEFFLSNA